MMLRRRGQGGEAGDWAVAESGPDLFTLHGPGGRVLRAGANAAAVLGVDAAALGGTGLFNRVHVQDRVAVAKALDDCASARRATSACFRLTHSAGEARGSWFEMRCAPYHDRDAGPAVLGAIRDVTQWREREAELLDERKLAETASVSKGLFLANMSHELRTPLNAILGFSELLQTDAMNSMPPERRREYVELIHSSASHLLSVLNDILDMSKIDAGKYEIFPEPFDLGHCLAASCAMMRGQAERKGVTLALLGVEALPEVTADERAVKQIVINLLSNAIKFSHEGGRVEVQASRVGRNVRIAVTDRGIGISEEHLAHLGKPFYQADSRYDRKYQGTGLGLSVVAGLVDLHRGRIAFSSRKGEGTTVTVTLPVHACASRPVPAPDEFEVVRLQAIADETRPDLSMARQSRVALRGAS